MNGELYKRHFSGMYDQTDWMHMSKITIKRVESKRDLTTFIDFHYDLYEGNPYDVPNLYMDEVNTLSKNKNAAFDFCEAEYYLAYKDGELVGRVAAIINHRANKKWNQKNVRFGWIDFVEDYEVAQALIHAVETYGKQKGMTHIVGPLGFTDMDPEGMLVEGFDQLGTMATLYNFPYYPQFIERMGGFEVDNYYVENKIFVPKEIPDRYLKIAEMIQKRYHLRVKKLTKDDIFKRGYGRRIFALINETYSHLYGFSELSEKQIDQYIDTYFKFIDLEFVTLIEDASADNRLVGIGITMPSLSKALQKLKKGRLLPLGWWHMLQAIKFHKTEGVDLLLVGVLPEYRAKGANSLLFFDLIPTYNKYGIKWGETQVEMETNESVQSQWKIFDYVQHKRRKCYIRPLK